MRQPVERGLVGSRLGGYEVVRLLGQGGMGAVYEARDPAGRAVALKVLTSNAANADSRQRFVREARAAAAVSHPNVTRVHAAGEDQGRAFIVFELVSGGSLGSVLKARGPLPWREAVAHAVGIARGLEAIHAAGFVHRDLKPDNVLLDEHGTPKVSDLGLVRDVERRSIHQLTKTGEFLGTPAFMAPEQVDTAKSVDARADVYALGATLFALLTAVTPFTGSGAPLIFAVLQSPAPSVQKLAPDVPSALAVLIRQCLEKDPARRPPSATAVAARLEAIAAGQGSGEKGDAAEGRRGLVAAGAVAVVLGALVTLGVVFFVPRKRDRGEPVRPTPVPSPSPTSRSIESLLEEAQRLLADGHRAAAAPLTSQAVARAPERPQAWLLDAEAREFKDPAAARRDVAMALHLAPQLASAHGLLAALEADAHHWPEAEAAAREALKRDPTCALATLALAEKAYALRKNESNSVAAELLRDGIRIATSDRPDLPRAASLRAVAETRRYGIHSSATLAAVDEAQKCDPESPIPVYLRARIAEDAGRFAEAIALFDQALALAPEHGPSYAARGQVRADAQGSLEAALADANRGVTLAPDDWQCWFARGVVRFRAGDFEGAIADLREAIDRGPPLAEAGPWHLEAVCELALQRTDAGLATIDAGIRRDTGRPTGYFIKAKLLAQSGDASAAAHLYQEAYETELKHPMMPLSDDDLRETKKALGIADDAR